MCEALLDRFQVGPPAQEGDGEQVDRVLDREVDPFQIGGSDRRQVDFGARQVDPLSLSQQRAVNYSCHHLGRRRAFDA